MLLWLIFRQPQKQAQKDSESTFRVHLEKTGGQTDVRNHRSDG